MKGTGWPWCLLLAGVVCASCSAVKPLPGGKKYDPETLRRDFDLFQNILEDAHPGLYWYQPKTAVDTRFRQARSLIKDSLSETGFRNVLAYALSGIGCGHTTIKPSKAYAKANRSSSRFFPLVLKLWPDTAFVIANLHRKDSLLTHGAFVHAIDGMPIQKVVDTLFQHLSTDGYNTTHKYQVLSNRGGFGNAYTALFGNRARYQIEFTDRQGERHTVMVPAYQVLRDTGVKKTVAKPARLPRKERRKIVAQGSRSLTIDTLNTLAVMDLGSFAHGYKLRRFFRQSFRELQQRGTSNLAIDLRGNGGGIVTYSNLLTRYLVNRPYKVADSLYAVRRASAYARYRNQRLANGLFLLLFTRRRNDGHFHFAYYERKQFHPKKKHHYNGQVYLLTGGNTFSAATLVTGTLKPQANVTVVGEETGGGAYGNNAWLIPDVTLPRTGVRFRLPLFRLVVDKNQPQTGLGIQPEVVARPNSYNMRREVDFKMEQVKALISKKEPTTHLEPDGAVGQ